jgi:transcriptional repressor NrdR
MRCFHCGAADTRVIDSRPAEGNAAIRRRRLCEACGERFTTYERREPATMVRKRDGRLEPFAPEKIAAGVSSALAGRPVQERAVAVLVSEIESRAQAYGGPVPTAEIGQWVLEALRPLDEVAYLRFASVYKEFEGASDFEKEMAALEDPS